MRKRKNNSVRISKAKVTDDDRTIYAILREEFTAADLQKYTEIGPLVPADQQPITRAINIPHVPVPTP